MSSDSETRLGEMVGGLPEEIDGWRKAGSEIYTPDDLYRYINGGAELFISFQFKRLISQPYARDDGAEIRFDVFDMGSAASAFGIFSHSRESIDSFVAPDVESEYASGLLHFWKGPYYATLLAYPETESKKALVRQLAVHIAAQIDEESRRPAVVSLFPETHLVPYSVRYFRHHAWLNDYHHFANENLLRLGDGTEAAMAKYRPIADAPKPTILLAVWYPTPAAAEDAKLAFKTALLPAAEADLQQEDDGGWLGCLRVDDLVIVVADAPDRETATNLLQACVRKHAVNRHGRP